MDNETEITADPKLRNAHDALYSAAVENLKSERDRLAAENADLVHAYNSDREHYEARIGELQARVAELERMVTERDGWLSKRPCQRDRCTEYAEALERERGLREALDAGAESAAKELVGVASYMRDQQTKYPAEEEYAGFKQIILQRMNEAFTNLERSE